ncbi:MAG: PQQ-dependent sugar dehydrogenase [Bacteroidota bacterium]
MNVTRNWIGALLLGLLWISCSKPTATLRADQKIAVFSAGTSEIGARISTEINNLGKSTFLYEETEWVEDDTLLSYASIILDGTHTYERDFAFHASLQRYLESGGGVILLNPTQPQSLSWPWLEKVLSRPKQSVAKVRNDEIAGFQIIDSLQGRLAIGNLAAEGRISAEEWKSLLTYSIGPNTYDSTLIQQAAPPKLNRFTRLVLDDYDVNEPMELAVLPNGKVLFIERRGKMKLYDPESETTKIIANFDVCTEGNYEDGLLGLTVDPNFAENHFIYLYYSPPCETWEQYLSQFVFKDDEILLKTEKVLLKVPVQRKTCCHSGGSLTFGPDGNLYLSTGDNTSSKESNGYTPIDTRPGRGPYDAQKSSANANDLRGKILRIKPNRFGSYDIPDGNLFPLDGSQGRPEIYVMGARNPFRISVDHKTRFVYWGDVGPDSGTDGPFGPASQDEFNQARKPGFFGWPYFVGNNIAYPYRDFTNDSVGERFNPTIPVNNSPNNTGPRLLPVAQEAFIWYGKSESKRFPMLGQGSNSAMAGPIYYPPAQAGNSRVKMPDYYTGKLFIYEWARSWIQVVSMNEAGDITSIEPFLPEMPLSKPIEMEIGPDGAIYMLEYGENYFMNNPSARLVKIEYAAGNRLPVPDIALSETEGAVPFTLNVSAQASLDYDEDDSLRFEWFFTDSLTVQAEGENARFTFEEPGVYNVRLKAIDRAGMISQSIPTPYL